MNLKKLNEMKLLYDKALLAVDSNDEGSIVNYMEVSENYIVALSSAQEVINKIAGLINDLD